MRRKGERYHGVSDGTPNAMKGSMDNTTTGLVLLFDTRKGPGTAARLHAEGCGMLNSAGAHVHVVREGVDAEVADLKDRGFKVPKCKCTRARKGA